MTAERTNVGPARDAAEARARFAALAARDDATISAAGRSRLLATDGSAERAVVLVHGFTNCPQQWVPFARTLYQRGIAVVIPRLPGHGESDRRGRSLVRANVPDMLATVGEAIDIACGLGEHVVACGLSIGSVLATSVALGRDDLARNVVVVPFFGLRGLPEPADRALAAVLRVAPNADVPWDPRGDGGQVPAYAYPTFPSKTFGRLLALGGDVVRRAHRDAPTSETVLVLNAREPAIDNGLARTVLARFGRGGRSRTRSVTWNDLPANHDIVDPTNALARVDLVYPRLLAEIERPFDGSETTDQRCSSSSAALRSRRSSALGSSDESP